MRKTGWLVFLVIVPLFASGCKTWEENAARGDSKLEHGEYESAARSYERALEQVQGAAHPDPTRILALETKVKEATERGEDLHRRDARIALESVQRVVKKKDWDAVSEGLKSAQEHVPGANDPELTQEIDRLYTSRTMRLLQALNAYEAMLGESRWERFKHFFGIDGKELAERLAKDHARELQDITREIADPELSRHALRVKSEYEEYIHWKREMERVDGFSIKARGRKWVDFIQSWDAEDDFEDRLETLLKTATMAVTYAPSPRHAPPSTPTGKPAANPITGTSTPRSTMAPDQATAPRSTTPSVAPAPPPAAPSVHPPRDRLTPNYDDLVN